MSKKLMIIFLGASFLLAACGQSGPLYLPPPPKPAQSMPSNQSATQVVNTDTNSLPS